MRWYWRFLPYLLKCFVNTSLRVIAFIFRRKATNSNHFKSWNERISTVKTISYDASWQFDGYLPSNVMSAKMAFHGFHLDFLSFHHHFEQFVRVYVCLHQPQKSQLPRCKMLKCRRCFHNMAFHLRLMYIWALEKKNSKYNTNIMKRFRSVIGSRQ